MPVDAFDSGRPEVAPFDAEKSRKLPLDAFALLETGDAFEVMELSAPRDGRLQATQYVASKVTLRAHGARPELVALVKSELVDQLCGNAQLVARLQAASPIEVDLIPVGKKMMAYGYPPSAATAEGLFWHQSDWPAARIGLLQHALMNERALVTHEMAHAIQRLAFTKAEQDLIYRVMLPTYQHRAWVDEVFAIYSEREFLPSFTEREGHAPGVYGLARRRWNERHVFTRFVRNLYHPHKPLAGSGPRVPPNLLG